MHRSLSVAILMFAAGLAAAQDKGVVTLDGLTSKTPAVWKEAATTSQMRYKQFTLPKIGEDKSDAELIIFFFGTGGGGGVQPNLTRWKDMFDKGKDKVEEFKVGEVKATYLDISGTYLFKTSPMATKTEPRANHRMLAVVFETPKGPYFIRLVGPEKTVTEHKKGFDEWLKSFK